MCTSLLLFFGAGEVFLRLSGLQTTNSRPPNIYQKSKNPLISYELQPNIQEKAYRNTVTTNSLGFRSPEIKPGSPLIALVGDSIVFGYGVKDTETLASVMQNKLPEYQVLNTGVPGYNLAQETAAYETKIAPLQPAALILVFHYNDLTDKTAWLDESGIIRDEGWVPTEITCSPITNGILGYLPGKCWLDKHSAFYKAFEKLLNIRYMNQELEKSREESQENPQEENVTGKQISAYAAQLSSLTALLPLDMPRIFVIWPDRQLHTMSRPQIRAAAESHGFFVVDLYDTFSNEVEILGWDTVHPSAKSIQEAVAEIIRKAQENNML